jgi:hypothetical protein
LVEDADGASGLVESLGEVVGPAPVGVAGGGDAVGDGGAEGGDGACCGGVLYVEVGEEGVAAVGLGAGEGGVGGDVAGGDVVGLLSFPS